MEKRDRIMYIVRETKKKRQKILKNYPDEFSWGKIKSRFLPDNNY